MRALQTTVFTGALLAATMAPAHAFLEALVVGMTSVTNNLIDSSESVTNSSINAATTSLLSLSSNPGKMADRIGLMADRIGYMADRIVTTEGMLAGLAHKAMDNDYAAKTQARQNYAAYSPTYSQTYSPSYANAYAPAPAPAPAPVQAFNGYQAPQYNPYAPQAAKPQAQTGYSASHMIYGVSGNTYTAARTAQPAAQAPVSAFGFAKQPAYTTVSNSCGISYGVALRC